MAKLVQTQGLLPRRSWNLGSLNYKTQVSVSPDDLRAICTGYSVAICHFKLLPRRSYRREKAITAAYELKPLLPRRLLAAMHQQRSVLLG